MTKNRLRDRYTILVVDDDAEFRNSQKRLLSRLRLAGKPTSFDVLEADTGEAAASALAGHAVDCLLLDHHMPGGSGTDWLPRILQQHPDVAVIMVTGGGSEQIAAQAMREGAMDYLVKGDISLASLERALLNALEKIGLRKTIEAQREQLIEAERHRAMIVSLAAARHHLGQPVAVIGMYLELMRRKETDPDMRTMIQGCLAASAAISEVLSRLEQVSEFRTEPYLPDGADHEPHVHNTILKI